MRFSKYFMFIPAIVAYITFSFFYDDNGDNFPSINEPRLTHTNVTFIYTNDIGESTLITPTSPNGLVHIINPGISTDFIIMVPGCIAEQINAHTDANVGLIYVKVYRTCEPITLPIVKGN